MKSYRILFGLFILLNLSKTCQGLFSGTSLQDFVDSFVDAAKFKFEGVLSLNDSAIGQMWSFFKSKYGRAYSSLEEEKNRLRIFRDHLQYVLQANLEKLRTFQLELNEFADWTKEEFNTLKKGLITSIGLRRNVINQYNYDYNDNDEDDENALRRSLQKLYQRHHHSKRLKRNILKRKYHDKRFFRELISSLFNLDKDKNNFNKNNSTQSTDSFDWRSKGVVSSIKNQLKCGCCYAFSTATILETLYALKTKSSNIIDFSAQQISDCSSNGNNGCNGGNFPPSIRYILGRGGKIATDASYPYVGARQACRNGGFNEINLGNIEVGPIPEGNEKEMANALVNYGPIFIGIDADSRLFMFYRSGVLAINNCPTRRQDMDHAMVVVGYGYDSQVRAPYWIIKNSWGTRWGENGYLRLAKDYGNMCGVASMAYYGKLV